MVSERDTYNTSEYNICTKSPSTCDGNLGIFRRYMQVPDDITDLIEQIRKISNYEIEPEKFIQMKINLKKIPVSELIPMQNEAWDGKISSNNRSTSPSTKKTLKYPGIASTILSKFEDGKKEGKMDAGVKFAEETFNKDPIWVLKHQGKYYVLDGHHRFFSFKLYNKIMTDEHHGAQIIENIPAKVIYLPEDVDPFDVVFECARLGYAHKELTGAHVMTKVVVPLNLKLIYLFPRLI